MATKLLTLALALLAPTAAQAVGSAIVLNSCGFPVTLWSVGTAVTGPFGIAPGASYRETFQSDPKTGGIALKITTTPDGLYTGAPQLVFSYALDAARSAVWHDLSSVFGDALAGWRLEQASPDPQCAPIIWEAGLSPGGASQTRACGSQNDVVLELCAVA